MLFPKVGHDTSNVHGFTTGSIVGRINIASGIVDRSVCSLGPGMRSAPSHPDTGAAIEGLRLPGWKDLLEMTLVASRALSPFRMQHWDVAFTTRGPVILEMNFIGDMEGPQLFGPPGIFSEQFRTFWETQRVW